jgi:hypothetical protein
MIALCVDFGTNGTGRAQLLYKLLAIQHPSDSIDSSSSCEAPKQTEEASGELLAVWWQP